MRLRQLLHGVNRQRKLQARKIDILCTDMVTAHRNILVRLEGMAFTNSLYESLVGCCGPQQVLQAISTLFAQRYGQSGTALIVLENDGLTISETHVSLSEEISLLPTYFTAENVRAICAANRVCTLPELLELPVEIHPRAAEKAVAAAVPLTLGGDAIGLLLLYNDSEKPLAPRLLHASSAIAPALARALASSHTAPTEG